MTLLLFILFVKCGRIAGKWMMIVGVLLQL
jgi:hypothetical protein